ncbi:MAG: NifU family protein [Candidatus Thermochlorobacter aerophilum]|jgi:Fe-S cluster biogenesis protein NfuA|uniref:NifU family protein n=1 Tax=Candidatus Thermochlorobacter aerophilus TaxID=1868324 RepID=A0A395M3H8_9BACT|nr:MAG: NifU family protein [Candidatus Thermochlorobacter aerophilum]RFM25536.1 MAG: NifU family protein [Candidatus Thermochlorobacter aerophilum]
MPQQPEVEAKTEATEINYLPSDHPIYAKVQEVLDNIRPYLQADGGDCQMIGIREDMTVDLRLVGACGSCPMSTMTLRAGVEQAIKRAVPEIVRVESLS